MTSGAQRATCSACVSGIRVSCCTRRSSARIDSSHRGYDHCSEKAVARRKGVSRHATRDQLVGAMLVANARTTSHVNQWSASQRARSEDSE
eukprot:6177715-Pleurochrysis_carterae.AAC.1